jgi:IclR family acetate operon transcriptional repressor
VASRVELLEKAMAILDVVGGCGVCSIAHISGALQLPFPTVHRLVQSLISRGYVIQQGRGRYRLGEALLRLAATTSLPTVLAGTGRPFVAELAEQHRTCAHLGVFDGDMVTYLLKECRGRAAVFSGEGAQLEAYCTAIGKVLLANLPDQQRQDYLRSGSFVPMTEHTIIDPLLLAAELAEVRSRGWALDSQESLVGLWCVAVPVSGRCGAVCAALSVSWSADTLQSTKVARIRSSLKLQARLLSKRVFPTLSSS